MDLKMLASRHPATQQIARWFRYEHLTHPGARHASLAVEDLAAHIIPSLPDGPELTAGLRKLLEAKDCFVRAALDVAEVDGGSEGAIIATADPEGIDDDPT